jgi:hypothetical protein
MRSGTNLVSCSLNAITRKPVGVFPGKQYARLMNERLGLDMISDEPFIYRTHSFVDVAKASPEFSRLVFLTRNPKELLLRHFSIIQKSDLHQNHIQAFLNEYLDYFRVLDSWPVNNRILLFYEDVIANLDQSLLTILDFIGEEPNFMDDYILHKTEYLDKILNVYKAICKNQRKGEASREGESTREKPMPIYYTQNKSSELLKYIDQVLEEKDPVIWEKYLKRFQTNPLQKD